MSVGFASTSLSFQENAGLITIPIQRDDATGPASVSVRLSDGTSTPGDFFSPNPTLVQLADGQFTTSLAIALLDNLSVQSDRHFTLSLEQPSPGLDIDPAHAGAIVNILDDDANQAPLVSDVFYTLTHDSLLVASGAYNDNDNGLLQNASDMDGDHLSVVRINGASFSSV